MATGDWGDTLHDAQTDTKTLANSPANAGLDPEEDRLKFSDEHIKNWIFGKSEKSSSNICCAIYGHDGTAKSGIAMDCRTDAEKKDGARIVIFDLDGGCAPLKVIYHDNDPNIIIRNPLVRSEDKNVDYEATFAKLKATLDFIERNMEKYKVKAIVFDGIDKFLKICEYSMRDEIGKGVDEGIDYRYWKLRNRKYQDVIEQIKLMDIDRYFITHLKKTDEVDEWIPDWEKKTGDMVFQKIKCFRETSVKDGNKIVKLKATIDKSKTNVALEGKEYVIAEVIQKADGSVEARWNGLRLGKDNNITQKT
jgi:hypothetical protein